MQCVCVTETTIERVVSAHVCKTSLVYLSEVNGYHPGQVGPDNHHYLAQIITFKNVQAWPRYELHSRKKNIYIYVYIHICIHISCRVSIWAVFWAFKN